MSMPRRSEGLLRVGIAMCAVTLQGCVSLPPIAHPLNPKSHEQLAHGAHTDATWLRRRAAFHEAMIEKVRANTSWSSPAERDQWVAHCQYLVKKYREAAEASDALAGDHERQLNALRGQ